MSGWIRILIAVVSGAAALFFGSLAWNGHNEAQQKIGYNRAMDEVDVARTAAATKKRTQEIEAQKRTDQEAKNAQQKIDDLERQRNIARADTERMRGLYREAAARGRTANPLFAGAVPGQPGGDAIGVFAELLERADRRAEEVAGYADSLRIAGESCERSYDAMSQ